MSKVIQFVKDSVEELKYKVSWPEYKKLQSDAILVLVASVVFAMVVFVIDFVFKNGMEGIYGSF
jgi:preprotein translocase subunit SecE